MTDEEKAAVFIKRHFGTYTEEFRAAMIPPLVKLIQDEREACAEVARDEVGDEFADPFSRLGETIRRIVSKIRARSSE